MENLILSFNVVLPLFIMIGLGYFLRQLKMFDEHTLNTMNNVSFRAFLPLLLFINIYNTDLQGVFNPKLIIFAITCVAISFLILSILIPKIEKDKKKQGVLIQGTFRSNFIIFGLPITAALFGEGNVGVTSIVVAFIVPIFNTLSVCTLEMCRGDKMDFKKIIKGIITNPLIIASMVGLFMLATGIKLPGIIEKTVTDISKVATPLALVILGGSFTFSSVKGYMKQLTIGVCGRLIIIPLVFIPIGILLGFRDVELIALTAMLSAPTAVSSFTMAQQMGGDSELAGQLVVFTSAFSMVTIFLWILFLKQFGYI